MNLPIKASALLSEFQAAGVLSELIGRADVLIASIAPIERAGPDSLVFIEKKEFLPHLESQKPAAAVTSAALKDQVIAKGVATVFIAPNVALAHALLKQKYQSRNFAKSGWDGVHPSAVIHPTASLGPDCVVEPMAVIGANAKIGRGARIMAGATIENDAVIGDDSVIHPRAVIGYSCRLGREVVVGSGAVIGSDGYGFAQDAKRKSHPIPQTGVVVIGDRVRIGANCCIDRATYGETNIGAGTKFDNLCHVGHNVQIGEDCLLTAGFSVAGSTKIGSRVIASGQTGVLDHLKVADDTVFLHRAGIAQDVDKPGLYAGLPLVPLNEYMRNSVVLKSAAALQKRVVELERAARRTEELESR